MNRLFFLLVLSPLATYGQEEEHSFQEFNTFDNMGSDVDLSGRTCFGQIKGRYDITAETKLTGNELTYRHFRFGEGEAAISLLHRATPSLGYSISLGYQNTLLNWDENPFFDRDLYHNGYLSFGVKHEPSPCWTWQAEVSVNVDLEIFGDHSTLFLYGGWGRFEFNDSLSTSVGFIGRSGIHQDRFWPVIGFEYNINDKWAINCIYPVNLSVIYNINSSFSLAVVAHVINNRHRIGPNEPLSNGIWEYRNTGVELALKYEMDPILSANIHIGVLAQGDLKITNPNDKHPTYLDSAPTGYAGAAASVRF